MPDNDTSDYNITIQNENDLLNDFHFLLISSLIKNEL